LSFALYSGHGEFPRVIFAPGTPEQAFFLTHKAFELAEKYQITVIILFDQYLGDTAWTFEEFDLKMITYTDYRLRGKKFAEIKDYKRHALTDTGVSPLGIPGDSRNLVVTDSDEHDEEGHLIEEAETRVKMVEKRLFKKLPLIRQEIAPPFLYGNDHPDIVLTGWGSTYGVIKEAVDSLSKEKSIAMLHFSELFPLPAPESSDYLKLLKNAKIAICIENNATGQFAHLLRAETGFHYIHRISKYDGRPFTVENLLGEVDAYVRRL
jgi:2-oxoglutarate ferredoxin oxidoreductase subunit alpha